MKPLFNWSGKTILIVEDDDTSYLYSSELIKKCNCITIRAKSGLDAFFQSMNSPKPDLIVMDIKLPEMSGYDAIRLIKKYQLNIPIIALTACAMNEQKKKCYQAGCDYYITKPVLPADLLFQINLLLEKNSQNEYQVQYETIK